MICECCRREVDYFKGSFWHGETRICRECFARWSDFDDASIVSGDLLSVGNYVRLKHGLPPLAAALTILLLSSTSTVHAARHCLDHAEAARAWPTRALVLDADGCWTYDHHPPRAETPAWMPQMIVPAREPTMMEHWPDPDLLEVNLSELDRGLEPASQATQQTNLRRLAMFVSLVLATLSVIEVATGRRQGGDRTQASRSTHWHRNLGAHR